MLVDPFVGGRALSREEAFEQIEQVAGQTVPRVDELLPIATHHQWISRILQNLINLFEQNRQPLEHAAMLELRELLTNRS